MGRLPPSLGPQHRELSLYCLHLGRAGLTLLDGGGGTHGSRRRAASERPLGGGMVPARILASLTCTDSDPLGVSSKAVNQGLNNRAPHDACRVIIC